MARTSEDGPRPESAVVLLAVAADLVGQLFQPEALAAIDAVADLHRVDHSALAEEPADILGAARVVVTGWGTQLIDEALLARMPNLEAVVHTGGSVRKVVTLEALQQGLLVSTQADTNAEPVADYTHAMVTLSLKGVFRSVADYRRQRERIDVYTVYRATSAAPPTVGVVGASRIGRRVIAKLREDGARILLYDPYCHDADALGVTTVGLDELFAASDVVSLHAPGTEETRHMITGRHLGQLRDGATLINTARGSIVEPTALEAELASGRIRAILDVTEPLVPSRESPLWELPNVLLTPHMAGAVGHELWSLGAGATAEVLRCLAGERMLHLVPAEQYARSA